jgi:hypothetical protein
MQQQQKAPLKEANATNLRAAQSHKKSFRDLGNFWQQQLQDIAEHKLHNDDDGQLLFPAMMRTRIITAKSRSSKRARTVL